ncbi:MAG TPA: bifunctional (p)ppGpp synthetase/guanosine-3',5'-bis(diphosphate) 3'-pyrophosphohydrolase [Campylobacterales bacterium]|nr:bifunctional (p)ppGpp synthetase/guanosine-3',5'-bis(diphosphate) 3'-pyrophosphohydrolase [Campylobacterales bacterium]
MNRDFLNRILSTKTVKDSKQLLLEYIQSSQSVLDAIDFAIEAHKGQKRKSGEPYVIHPILVASIVANISGNESMVVSALLHDVVEDTQFGLEDIRQRFGDDVAFLVDGLTKIDTIREKELLPSNVDGGGGKLTSSALSFRKMVTASIQDIRVLIIKLCDRVHNLLTLDALPEKKQLRIAEESLVVYAPIAHRLGISSLKSLIEDLSFKYLFKKEYEEISSYIDKYEESLRVKLHNFRERVAVELVKNGFDRDEFTIKSRIKHKYSIYRKMQKKGINIDEVLDLLAIRIIVPTPIDAYRALGIVHLNFKPLAFRFKDYISLPKENGYQTLHTTVIDKSSIFEVQIRTFEMDRMAEYGLAAHWKYKQSINHINTDWIASFGNSKENFSGDYRDIIKYNLFTEDIHVYSPTYEVFTLPSGSVALDFAYKIHSDLGNRAKFAYVNKRKVSLLTELQNGDIVKIITDDKPIPRCSWIDSVKTHQAIKGIKALCNQRIREIDTQTGFNILKTIFGFSKKRVERELEKLDFVENIYKIATNRNSLNDIVSRITQRIELKNKKFLPFLIRNRYKLREYQFKSLKILSNRNIDGVKFDYCCHPYYGDSIVGVLKNSDVYVHHKMCSKIGQDLESLEMVYIEWKETTSYKYYLIVSLSNHRGALADFLKYLAKMNIDIISIKSEKDKTNSDYATYFELEIETAEKSIEKLEKKLQNRTQIIQLVYAKDKYRKSQT